MTAPAATAAALQAAKDLLLQNGFVVLTQKSYRAAQERQRLAAAMRVWAVEQMNGQRAWMENDVFPRERALADRLTFVYGVARAHGATHDELSNPDAATR